MATSKTRSSNGRSKTARTSGSRAKSSERDGSGGLDKAKLTLIAGGSAFVGAASGGVWKVSSWGVMARCPEKN